MSLRKGIGPKTGYRKFDGQVFALGFFRTRGIHKQEVPEAEARIQAKRIRKLGVNARVVKGKGWAAVYVGMPKQKPRKVSKGVNLASLRAGGLVPTRKRSLLLEGRPGTPRLERKRLDDKEKLLRGMSVLMWKENDYFGSKGLGRIFPAFEIEDNARVTDFEIVNLQTKRGQEFLSGLTEAQGIGSFKSWIKSAGRSKETKWKGHDDLAGYFQALKEGEPADLNVFIIYVDGKAAYWSPLEARYASEITGGA